MNLPYASAQCMVLLACAVAFTLPARAADPVTSAVRASGQASVQASGNAAHAIAASGRATLAVSAMPLAIGGSIATTVGQGSTASADAMLQGAGAGPLPLTDEVITVVPPDVALRRGAAPQPPAAPQPKN